MNSHERQKARREELRKEKPKKKLFRHDKTGGIVIRDKVRISKGNLFVLGTIGFIAVYLITNYNF